MFLEADCFVVYRKLRTGVPENGHEIGEGFNTYKCTTALVDVVVRMVRILHAEGRLEQYSATRDDSIELLCKDLVGRRFGCALPDNSRVLFANGGSEAIGIALASLAELGFSVALPLPTYYCYEQSALRNNLSVAARYRVDTGAAERFGDAKAVVLVYPNALTGSFGEGGNVFNGSNRSIFKIHDIVFQIPDRSRLLKFEENICHQFNSLDLSYGCLILTPSKDLSVPSFRAGMIVTANASVIEYARRDRFERTFSVSPLIPLLCALYLAIVMLYREWVRSGEHGFAVEFSALAAMFTSHGIAMPADPGELQQVLYGLEQMTKQCSVAIDTVRRLEHIFDPGDVEDYSAGFSCFPRLRINIKSHEEFCDLVNAIGRSTGLKINPSVLFGGTFASWNRLYPHEPRIRVNLSGPSDQLTCRLEMLRNSFEHLKQGPSDLDTL